MRRLLSGIIILLIIIAGFSFYLYLEKPELLPEQFLYRAYPDRLSPSLDVTLNHNPVSYTHVQQEWSFQLNNGRWVSQEKDQGAARETGNTAVIRTREDKFEVLSGKTPDDASLRVTSRESGKLVLEGKADLNQLPLPDKNGDYIYELTLTWADDGKPYRGKTVINIPVVTDYPERIVFSKDRVVQGEIIEITVYNAGNPDDTFLEQEIYEQFRWYQHDDYIRGYLPTNYNVKPGVYRIKYGNRKKGIEFTKELEVVAQDYRIQRLTVDKKTEQETRNEEAYEEYNKYFTPVRKQSEQTRYYTEPFILPVQGRLTTEFGQIRYVNNEPSSSRHSGIDIAAPQGKEIKAVNRGKVVLARHLILTGNTVVIDHGEGLFSVYYHMHKINVNQNDIVERGQIIGTVGSTGFSTGPHLHFTMSYYTVNVDPGFILVGQPITMKNYQEILQKPAK